MTVESLFHYQLIVDIYCYHYYIFIVFNTTLILIIPYKTSDRYLNYRVVKNIVATTISFSLSVEQSVCLGVKIRLHIMHTDCINKLGQATVISDLEN